MREYIAAKTRETERMNRDEIDCSSKSGKDVKRSTKSGTLQLKQRRTNDV